MLGGTLFGLLDVFWICTQVILCLFSVISKLPNPFQAFIEVKGLWYQLYVGESFYTNFYIISNSNLTCRIL